MKNTLYIVVAVALAFITFDYMLSIPNVLVSHSTGFCVDVENYPGVYFGQEVYNCENMPTKYNHVWVK